LSRPGDQRASFLSALPFPPDPFQLRAFDALDAQRSVLVAAPTGSGKTLVADYAVTRSMARGGKAFYTTPLKALSNQKFGDLAAEHGWEGVGLLTGDTSRRAEAPVVVMTTEVLRNMLLTGSPLLRDLTTVILDEVHFLQDPYRGGVWEEVLVLAPPTTTFVCLSATVANAEDLGRWITSVRGATDVIVERRRPIRLRHHFALQRRGEDWPTLHPLLQGRRPHPDASEIDRHTARALASQRPFAYGHRGPRGPVLPYRTPRRAEMVELLGDVAMLPAIVFIFSRAACDDAVRQCVQAGLRLTDRDERAVIRSLAETHVESITDVELDVLGYPHWLAALESGMAAHHAGLVPAFRETVEACFAAGLLKVVFATETLSLGINMPARSVVIERFSKFGAGGHAALTSGDYIQLTGRAGRRGLDEEGHAVVLWNPEPPLVDMAAVAAGAPPDLRSSFRPTYNLTANLVRRFDRARALDVLRRSFAQWQIDHPAPPSGGTAPTRRNLLTDHLGRRLAVLEEMGYVRGWSLTDAGQRLARIYHEADLLVAELLDVGVLDGSEPSTLAAVLSALVFEPRRSQRLPARRGRRQEGDRAGRRPTSAGFAGPGDTRPGRRGGGRAAKGGRRSGSAARQRGGGGASSAVGERQRRSLDERVTRLVEVSARLHALEEVHRLPPTRRPEPALATAVMAWAGGADLGVVLELATEQGIGLAAGDFVRMVKQVADLVGQVALVAPAPATAAAAAAAVPHLVRAVVANPEPEPVGESTTAHPEQP
jgi:superfamily II RNA helicase